MKINQSLLDKQPDFLVSKKRHQSLQDITVLQKNIKSDLVSWPVDKVEISSHKNLQFSGSYSYIPPSVSNNYNNKSILESAVKVKEPLPKDTLNKENQSLVSKMCSNNKIKLLASSVLGLGTGMAMMPIFNEEIEHLEKYGVEVHNSQPWFIVSTINTLMCMGTYSACLLYKYFNKSTSNNKVEIELTSFQQKAIKASKICVVAASIMPVSLLWNIELEDQEVEGSSGFDKFIAWATFVTLPLIIFKSLKSYQELHEFITKKHNTEELNNLGSKIVVYGIDGVSAVARGIAYSAATKDLIEKMGADEDTALGLGVSLGGILANSIVAVSEHSQLKSLFANRVDKLNIKEIFLGIFSAIEGGWFALPSISVGLNATKDLNPLIKGGLFTPLFLVNTNFEATNIFKSLIPEHQELPENELETHLIGNNSEEHFLEE